MDSDPKSEPGTAPTLANATAHTVTDDHAHGHSGELVHERYRLDAVLGRGGMGEVLSARDEQIGRAVAIKRMRAAEPSADSETRFLREARVQGRLEHPAVVPVHELSRDEAGRPFFVMKQLAGVTLGDVLARLASGDADTSTRFSRLHLLRLFADVCLAIEFAHTRGVIHRDLKPANIMLGDFGEVYVLDWGIARVAGEHAKTSFADVDTLDAGATLAGEILGTPGYMAPEQVRGDTDLDARADIYALGCILFEILAGEPLHPRGQAAIGSALAGIDGHPAARRSDRDISPELDAACAKAVAAERTARFSTARELGDAVTRFLDGDRDVERRRQLAREALATAREALARDDRRAAIRDAARAIALAPDDQAAVDFVGKLMLETPARIPPEVDAHVAAIETEALKLNGRYSVFVTLAYVVFFPILYLIGFRGGWYYAAGAVAGATMLAFALRQARQPSRVVIFGTFAANAVLIAIMSRMLTPFLVAPTLAVITGMVFAMHMRTGPRWFIWVVMSLAVLLPYALELGGAVTTTTTFVANRIVLTTAASVLDSHAASFGLTLYTMIVLGMPIIVTREVAANRYAAQRAVELQSWQLRQLVPGRAVND